MHLVVGLGNPGREYEGNRHNAGFLVLDELRRLGGLPDFKEKFSGVWTKGDLFGRPVALLKPSTFMNLSGESVQPASAFLKVPPSHIVVVHDELDLSWKDVRVKVGGGHAGHNGLRSLIQRLGTPEFVRIRVGVGKPGPGFKGDIAAWVLSNFDALERVEWPGVEQQAVAAVRAVLEVGPAAAMTAANRSKEPAKPKAAKPAS
ncbi:MAG TPA: aminoacyl-tRNA hydrolase [Polyangiaceae bacterium]|jgi:PTH1 family peptidyl-tRNA hydrolase